MLSVLAGCPAPGGGGDGPGDGGSPPPSMPDLVVDADRSGKLDLDGTTDEAGEDAFSATSGAVVLANLDDDDGDKSADADTAAIDSDDDLLDFAPLAIRAAPRLIDGTTGTLSVDASTGAHTRLFRFLGGDPALASGYDLVKLPLTLTDAELRSGATFLVEARDVVTSASNSAFKGLLRYTLTVTDSTGATLSTDVAQLRIAPVIFQWNTLPTTKVFHSNGRSYTQLIAAGIDKVRGTASRVAIPQTIQDFDPWAQDFFDLASMVAPAADGSLHEIKVAVRSAQPDRVAGEYVQRLLGKDVASLEIAGARFDANTHGYSMNSFGNWDVIPPYEKGSEKYPLGRNLWGSGPIASERPDPVFADFVQAQQVQPQVNVDTEWLAVGHVDEFLSFVPAPSTRGWVMLMADPTRAKEMLQSYSEAGHGDAVLFAGKEVYDLESENPQAFSAEATVDQILHDDDRLAESQRDAAIIDDNHMELAAELGLAEDEIKSIPFLFESVFGQAIAYQPGTVNMLVVNGKVLVPKPFGPRIDGADPFETDILATFAPLNVPVEFVDDWDTYHANMGEVHCGSNAWRTIALHWWETGR